MQYWLYWFSELSTFCFFKLPYIIIYTQFPQAHRWQAMVINYTRKSTHNRPYRQAETYVHTANRETVYLMIFPIEPITAWLSNYSSYAWLAYTHLINRYGNRPLAPFTNMV